jgi:hypothetical protein
MYTAWLQDQAALHPDDEVWSRRSDLLLPIVKGYASERAYEQLAQSLQVLGGVGFTQDFPLEQYLRYTKIDSIYEGTTGIQALDLFFRKIARDQGATLASLAAEITEFVKGGRDRDPLAAERAKLGRMLDDVQAHLGSMVENLLSSSGEHPDDIYKVGLQTNALLDSMAEVVIGWRLLVHAEIAGAHIEEPFYRGKVEAAKWFIDMHAVRVEGRRALAVAEDGSIMDLPVAGF